MVRYDQQTIKMVQRRLKKMGLEQVWVPDLGDLKNGVQTEKQSAGADKVREHFDSLVDLVNGE